MLKISYAAISSQFAVEMCAAVKNFRKFTKNPFFGSSRLFKVIDVKKSKNSATSACYDKRHVCTYLQPLSQYRRANNGKITFFRGVPLFDVLV